MQEELWRPGKEFIDNSNLKDYQNWLERNYKLYFDDYNALWEWSVHEIESFWESIWKYFDIISHSEYKSILSGSRMPYIKWFEGATLNYSEHVFRQSSSERDALIFYNEEGVIHRISWDEMKAKVTAIRAYLVEIGIKKGDCVAGFIPNIPEATFIFLAVNSLGAIWSCCSPDFGVNTVVERFSQIEPKVLFTVDGYRYNTKPYPKEKEVLALRDQLPSLQQVITIPYLNKNSAEGELWTNIISKKVTEKLEFVPVEFSHPIWVLFSSGTTGKPKAITHSHGGVLLEHLKYMAFHNDVHEGENFFWFSTTGWMMWNFLQASLLMGATPVLFDGSPGYPDLNILWKLTEEIPIHHFGTSAPYLVACMNKELKPGNDFNLSRLRSIGSTGAPLPPEAFQWVYDHVSKDVWLCSMSGGTDVCTAFVGGCPFLPVYKGAIQCRGLGCSLKSYNDAGEEEYGILGEMIIDKPMPSMPIYFWNDPNFKRYKTSYFEDFEGSWRHGDFIRLYENGSLTIHGRSDATLNRKGIRIGTAEIYNVLNGMEDIADALILNLEQENGDDVMPLFVILNEGIELNDELKAKINRELRNQCSPRHVPDMIIETPDIPYTLSGKKMEVPVKKILMGLSKDKDLNRDAVKNPSSMDFFLEIGDSLFHV